MSSDYQNLCRTIRKSAEGAEVEEKQALEMVEKISAILENYEAEVRSAPARLEHVKRQLPALYAARLIEGIQNTESTENQIQALEQQIPRLQGLAEFGPETLGHLECLKAEAMDATRKSQAAIGRLKALDLYEGLKGELRVKYTEAKLKALRSASYGVDVHGPIRRDYGEFIEELKLIHRHERNIQR